MPTEQRPAPIDRKRLRSQRLREVNFQGDALRLGMNWTEEDLRKPQVRGVPALMLELRDLLHLDCITVSGKTLGENLEEVERSKFFMRERLGYLRNFKIAREAVDHVRLLAGPPARA